MFGSFRGRALNGVGWFIPTCSNQCSTSKATKEGNSPVSENGLMLLAVILKYPDLITSGEAGRTILPGLNTSDDQ